MSRRSISPNLHRGLFDFAMETDSIRAYAIWARSVIYKCKGQRNRSFETTITKEKGKFNPCIIFGMSRTG